MARVPNFDYYEGIYLDDDYDPNEELSYFGIVVDTEYVDDDYE